MSDKGHMAEWQHVYSGGCLFSASPISRDQEYHIRLFGGSSHVNIGYTCRNPYTIQNVRVAFTREMDLFKEVMNIRLHKTELEVIMSVEHDKIVCKTKEETISSPIGPHSVWMCIILKFGKAQIGLESTTGDALAFHPVCGENITFEDGKARLKKEVPSSICCMKNSLSIGDKIEFKLEPEKSDQGFPPHYYHVLFGASSFSPEELRVISPELFSVSNIVTALKEDDTKSHWGMIYAFEKKGKKSQCDGTLSVERISDVNVRYEHETRSGSVTVDGKHPMYLMFELFRTVVHITKYENENNSSSGYTVVSPGKHADPTETGARKREPQEGSDHT